MTKTPILVMAFNRPRTLSALLSRIEKLDKREVMISIDGPTIHGSKEQQCLNLLQHGKVQVNTK